MINRPSESELLKLAQIETDKDTPLEDRVIHMHFFLDGHDWYLSEYDPQRRQFFGYLVPNDDYHNARWDYFSFDELCRMRAKANAEVVRNTHWKPKRAIEVDRIRDAYTWRKNLNKSLKNAKRKIARNA
jgi:hypothetical protein